MGTSSKHVANIEPDYIQSFARKMANTKGETESDSYTKVK